MSNRWRKPLNSYQTKYKMHKEGIQRILRYFYEYDVKGLFVNGKMTYWLIEDRVRIEYQHKDGHTVDMEFTIEVGNRRRADELRMIVQDFIVDTFFDYERDWSPVDNKELARLFGVTPQALTNTVTKIKEKLRQDKDLLWHIE